MKKRKVGRGDEGITVRIEKGEKRGNYTRRE